MEDYNNITTSKKTDSRSTNLLIILGLILGLLTLSFLGYFVYREYNNIFSKKESDVKINISKTLQPEFAQKEKKTELPSQTFSINKDKVSYLDNLIKNFGDNAKFLTSFVVTYEIEAYVQEIKNMQTGFSLTLRNSANNLIEIKLTNEEVRKIKVFSETPANIEELSFFNLAKDNKIKLTAYINLIDKGDNNYQIEVLSK